MRPGTCAAIVLIGHFGSNCIAGAAADGDCLGPAPLQIRVRIAAVTPAAGAAALVSGASPAGLQLRDAATGALWWTVGSSAGSTLRIAGMDAAFIGRPAALDLDGDGLHDLLYAVDLMGRLWRLDLHHGRALPDWSDGGLLADLADADPLRRFVAAPDIALHAAADQSSWVSIAFGSVSVGAAPPDNRFFVIHDRHPAVPWRERPDRGTLPYRPSDLRSAAEPDNPHTAPGAGYSLAIGPGQVLTPSLTLDGRVFFSAAHARLRYEGQCLFVMDSGGHSTVEVQAIDARSGGSRSQWPATYLPTLSAVHIAPAVPGTPDFLDCMIGAETLPGCRVDVRPRRRYWYMEGLD